MKEEFFEDPMPDITEQWPYYFWARARRDRLYSKFGFLEEGRFKDRVGLPDGSFVDDLAMAWFPVR